LVGRGRNLRREFNLPANKKVRFVFKNRDPVAPEDAEALRLLLNAESLDVDPNAAPPKGTPSARTDLGELFLPLEGLVDLEAERARLTKELAKTEAEIGKVRAKLDNPSFVQKVPPTVLAEHQKRLTDWAAKRAQVQSALHSLG
jgi:valyl-tRNA synthetase